MCYVVIISPYLPGDYIYRNGLVRYDLRSDFFWECTRVLQLQTILCLKVAF